MSDDTVSTGTEDTAQAPLVRVALLGGDASTFDFVDGRTVNDYLELAGITPGTGQSITMDGETVGPDRVVTTDENVVAIVVASKIRNG